MYRERRRRGTRLFWVVCCTALVWPDISVSSGSRLDGVNVIVSQGHPFGSVSARHSLELAKGAGAKAIAIVPFLWQPNATSPEIARGSDMNDAELRAAIRAVHSLGLVSIVKPHVWVDGSWAGAIEMKSKEDWLAWFNRYQNEMLLMARIAAEERAEMFCIGTELDKTFDDADWTGLIVALRAIYPGQLTYSAHNVDGAEQVPFWKQLDSIGVTLYPPLGDDADRTFRQKAMTDTADRLDVLAKTAAKQIIVSEVGIRSAQGAAAKPWESAEERAAPPDAQLQADVLEEWLTILDRPSIHGVLIWRWLTDPNAGGMADTDFTIQGKTARHMITCKWTRQCGPGSDVNLPK